MYYPQSKLDLSPKPTAAMFLCFVIEGLQDLKDTADIFEA
jgi:hypothetical protein